MAAEGGEVDYESDPEDALLPAMRRREASDDEDGEGSDGGEKPAGKDQRATIGYDDESDGQGGAPGDEYEELDGEVDDEDYLEEEVEELEGEVEAVEGVRDGVGDSAAPEEGGFVLAKAVERSGNGEAFDHEGKERVEEEQKENKEEEKKESEPYAVPTSGAFYMHDDRFRDNGRGRHRRMPGGHKLWESRDDRAWVHDRFEEMNLQDARRDEERRMPRGRFRGRGSGKTRPIDRGHAREDRSGGYDDNNNQIRGPKFVKGRGPRRYEPSMKNTREFPARHNKQFVKSREVTSNSGAERHPSRTSKVQPDPIPPQKHVFASSLNSASPPFYPSGSANQDLSMTQKNDAHAGIATKVLSSSMQMEDKFSKSQSGLLLRGKAVVGTGGHDGLYIDSPIRPVAGKPLASSQFQTSLTTLSSNNTTQSSQSRAQERSIHMNEPRDHQHTSSFNHVVRVSASSQHPAVQESSTRNSVQSLHASNQQMGQRPGTATQTSVQSQALVPSPSEAVEGESPPVSSKSKTLLVGKGNSSNLGMGRGSFLYSNPQVIGATGAMGLAHGDQNFPGTPALLPVMQFGGQHPGGLGVPAVGMALPGYVAQSQLGFGNSEMTWLPVLAGAAGALGGSYCPPYIAIDNSYYPRPSGQKSSPLSSSRENSETKLANNTLESPQRPEPVNDEFGQRQNKPRRYSEMNFGQ